MLNKPEMRLSRSSLASLHGQHTYNTFRPCPATAASASSGRRLACHCSLAPTLDSTTCRRTSSIGASTSTSTATGGPGFAQCSSRRALGSASKRTWQQGRLQRGARVDLLCCQAGGSKGQQGGSDEEDADADDDEPATAGRPLRVERLLANLGYGKRKECQAVVRRGRVTRVTSGKPVRVGDKVRHSEVLLDGESLDPPYPMAIVLHKPVGYVVTSPDDERVLDPVVYDLLPHRFGRRRPFLSCVGRLDKDTSGLLMLTDDGQLLHRITSPKKGIWKRYRATLAKPLTGADATAMARKFASGTLLLVGDRMPLLPARLDMLDDVTAEVALCEGRYHQIRRMFGSQGYEVVSLHRHTIGGLDLTGVEEGQWRFATEDDIQAVFGGPDLDIASEAQQKRLPAAAPSTSTAPSSSNGVAVAANGAGDSSDSEWYDTAQDDDQGDDLDGLEGADERRTLQRRYRSSDRWKLRRGALKRQVSVLAAQRGGSDDDSSS